MTQGVVSKEKKYLCKLHKLWEKFYLPYGYFNGKKIITNKESVNNKELSKEKKYCIFIIIIFVSYGIQMDFP